MKNFLTTEQMVDASRKLRERLEAKQPGCTAAIPVLDLTSLNHDEILAQADALKAVESGLASKSSVDARGASVAARYVKPLAQQIRDGDVTAKRINTASEIARTEKLLAACKPGTTSHAALTAKVASLRSEFSRLPKPTPKN